MNYPVPARRPAAAVAAPVSRTSYGANGAPTRSAAQITLSPKQREAARFSGVDEKVYARNVARLNELKRRGYYQETG